jgi:hypothetical protein
MRKLLKSSDITKYLVAAILLAVPLYPKFPFIRVPGTFVSIRLEDFLLAVVSVIFVFRILPNVKKFLENKINKAIFLSLSIGFLSLITAIFVTKTVEPHIGFLHWLRRIEYFVPFFVGFLVIKERKENLEFYLKVLMISVILAFLYGLGQRYLNWPVIITQNLEYSKGIALRWTPGSHINSTFAGHYDLATFLVMILPAYICLFFLLKGWRTKVMIFIVFSAGLWLLGNSGSRISVVSYLGALTIALFLIKKYKAIPLVIILSLVFFSMSSSLMARYSQIIEVTSKKILKINNVFFKQEVVYATDEPIGILKRRDTPTPTQVPPPVFEDRSTSIRLNIEWPRAIRALSKNPLLGTGYSSITLATDNDYLRLLGEVGTLGFLAFSLIFFRIGRSVSKAFPLIKKYKGVELGFLAGMIGSFPGLLLNAVFIDIFEASKFAIIFWLLMGFAVGLVSLNKNE